MKKCAVLYTNTLTGEERWACSYDEHGCSYCLRPRISVIPRDHNDAAEFYGKNRKKRAIKMINNDQKFHRWYGWKASIIEYDGDPHWYFELQYVLANQYGNHFYEQVPKRFPLREDVKYRLVGSNTRPLICDLPLDELQRLYEWRKANYKGKIKEEI